MAMDFPLPQQLALNLFLNLKPGVTRDQVAAILQANAEKNAAILNTLKNIHFVRAVLIEQDTILLIMTVFDGTFANHYAELTGQLGSFFDPLLASVINDAPPTPIKDNADAFIAFCEKYNVAPLMFYSSTPKHGV